MTRSEVIRKGIYQVYYNTFERQYLPIKLLLLYNRNYLVCDGIQWELGTIDCVVLVVVTNSKIQIPKK